MIHLILGLGNPGEEYRATRHNAGFRVVDELARRWGVRLDRVECNALTARVDLPPTTPAPPASIPEPAEAASDAAGADAVGGSAAAAAAGEVTGGLGAAVAGVAGGGPGAVVAGGGPGAVVANGGLGTVVASGGLGAAVPGVATGGPIAVLLAQPQGYMNRSGFAARCLAESHALEPARILVVYDEVNLPLGRMRLRRAGSPAGHRGMESIAENLRSDQIARLRLGIAQPGGAPAGGDELVAFVLAPFEPAEEEAVRPLVERAADACETWLRLGIDAAMNRFNAA